jgi:hypothetical protein
VTDRARMSFNPPESRYGSATDCRQLEQTSIIVVSPGITTNDLLLPDRPVRGVTTGRLRPELSALAVPTKADKGAIPDNDPRVEAGYGFRGRKNAVMCGKGRLEAKPKDSTSLDVYINDKVFWSNVPNDVRDLTIGGYPVVKKWLSYREYKILGRSLRLDEVTYVTEMVRQLKALLIARRRLGPSLCRGRRVRDCERRVGRRCSLRQPEIYDSSSPLFTCAQS